VPTQTTCIEVGISERPLLTHHVAKRLKLSCRIVRHLARTGRLPARRIGDRAWEFRVADVEAFRLQRESNAW
jgi:excisionase family DNA binding protein